MRNYAELVNENNRLKLQERQARSKDRQVTNQFRFLSKLNIIFYNNLVYNCYLIYKFVNLYFFKKL